MRALIIAVVLAGCAVDAEPQLYTCTIVYRCATDPTPSAAVGFSCAADDDEANQRITDAAWAVIAARCEIRALQYVRPLCSVYQPAEACTQ